VILNVLIFLYFLGMAPKILWDRMTKGKRHPGFLQRLGFLVPDSQGKPVIWLHAVSVGEVKSAQPLFAELKKLHPNAFFLITTTSATGQAEAKRSLSSANAYAYLPIDLAWVVKRWLKKLCPRLLLIIESDFWPNLLANAKKQKIPIALISGKISERSARRFNRFPTFSKKLFSYFDLLCVQNQEYADRFHPLVPDPSRIHITGNLKLDVEPQPVDIPFWQSKLQLPSLSILTISCTHSPEEEWLLDALVDPRYFFFLAPRHPERFNDVAQLLDAKQIPYARWSSLDSKRGGERVILVDSMGQLPICYSLSRLAILGGSYVDRIGGHNVLEPCLYGIPVLFGPHMFGQKEFAARVARSGAGLQIPLQRLRSTVEQFFQDPFQENKMRAAAAALIASNRGSVSRTLDCLHSLES